MIIMYLQRRINGLQIVWLFGTGNMYPVNNVNDLLYSRHSIYIYVSKSLKLLLIENKKWITSVGRINRHIFKIINL